ncbi:HAMP domain-containing histidine kinase [Pelosinus sp. Bkl1]|uniref:histidine kinase n=2 Tax=Pelosinus baikalensis TaxID=2892015 RepID=A0ABS8HYM2_9FIRM|nr:HAMP domain-containing histidine kinase [Pelosinus baikalensis]
MFRKVMLKLTVLNSAVLLIVFIIYGIVIYIYIDNNLFKDIDSSMVEAITDFSDYNKVIFPQLQLQNDKFKSPYLEEQRRKPHPLFDLRILVVAEDVDGRILIPEPNEKINIEDITTLLANTSDGSPQSKTINGHDYRILSISYPADRYPTVRVGKAKIIAAKKIIAITVVDPEISMINRLMVIIMAGTASGFFVIIWAGHYLARRALVPIKASWDKQQQFVTDASHELRTPIAVIKTNTELLLHHPEHIIEEESVRIAGILKESTRMGNLVATLLTLARADSNQIEMNFRGVLLPDLLHDIIEQIQPIAEMKGIHIYTEFDPQIEVRGDRERLYQLFVILLDNAVKYTPAKGHITITSHINKGSVHVSVQDTGIGISKEDIPFIFERFYRGDKVRSCDDGGSGLGLAIAKWIIDKHRGKIRVDSIKGEGTKFYLQLPLEKKV